MSEDNDDVDWDVIEAREMAGDEMDDIRAQNEKMRKIIVAADDLVKTIAEDEEGYFVVDKIAEYKEKRKGIEL